MKSITAICFMSLSLLTSSIQGKDTSIQLAENPPMQIITKPAPEPKIDAKNFETRKGFKLITTLDEFREAIKKSNQKIRMKPGIYRAKKIDPPSRFTSLREKDKNGKPRISDQHHIFLVSGSSNYFDLRNVVIETPVSLMGKLSKNAHVADSWHVNGAGNTFEGAYFRNIVDKKYPKYFMTECEFEICNDNNTFLNCTFHIKGSVPYGYTDYYGKGGPNFGRLNKHSFMSILDANNTKLIGCKVYMHSFGHGLHMHKMDNTLVKGCKFYGALRPTNDIYKEKSGRAKKYGFNAMYRGKRPIPKNTIIPLTEDAIRFYNDCGRFTMINSYIERFRGCFQLLGTKDIILKSVTVSEAGDFAYDLSVGKAGKVIMKKCKADIAHQPLFNLSRGALPEKAFYEITIIDPPKGVKYTKNSSLGVIAGNNCTFIIHNATKHPISSKYNVLKCGGYRNMPLKNSTIINYTKAKLILNKVSNCTIKTAGTIKGKGKNNKIIKLKRKNI